MGVMLGSLVIQRKEWKLRIGIGQQVEIVTEVPTITGRIPSHRTIWLREVAITITIKDSFFPAIAGVVGAEAGSSDNRGAIASNVKLIRIDLTTANGFVQEASAEDPKQQTIRFLIDAESDLRKSDDKLSNGFLLNGSSLLSLSLRLFDLLPYRWFDLWGEVRRCEVPKPVNEVVEGANAGKIPGLETTEDGKER